MKSRRKVIPTPALAWLDDLSGKSARITSIGSSALMVENHCGVEKYDACCVCLSTRRGIMKIEGEALLLREMRKGALIVSGDIRRVELPCEDAP